MMKGTIRAALVMAAMAGTAASVGAAELDPTFDAEGVRIMNNHGETVRVFAEDAAGDLYRLGTVRQGELEEFEVPAELANESFRIKVYPTAPDAGPVRDAYGVKTNPISLDADSHITVWVERDLTRTVVELARG